MHAPCALSFCSWCTPLEVLWPDCPWRAGQKTIEFYNLIEAEATAECLWGRPGGAAPALHAQHHRD